MRKGSSAVSDSMTIITQSAHKGVGLVIMNKYIIFCYIIIVNFVVFHLFQFSNDLLFNKSSVQKRSAQEVTKDSNTCNSFKLENCQPSTVSGHHNL